MEQHHSFLFPLPLPKRPESERDNQREVDQWEYSQGWGVHEERPSRGGTPEEWEQFRLANLQHCVEGLRQYAHGNMDDVLNTSLASLLVNNAERSAEGFDGPGVQQIKELRARAWERTMWHCFNALQEQYDDHDWYRFLETGIALDHVREEGTVEEEVLRYLLRQLAREREALQVRLQQRDDSDPVREEHQFYRRLAAVPVP